MKKIACFLLTLLLPVLIWAQSASGCISGNCENGFGEYLYPSGDSYVGYWNNGVRYGGGTYNYIDGSRFVGSYANNMRHGKGTYTSANGQKLSGRWAKGKFIIERAEARSYVQPTLTKAVVKNMAVEQENIPVAAKEVADLSINLHNKTTSRATQPNDAAGNSQLRQVNDEILVLEDIDPEKKAALETEAMKLLKACTGYADNAIKAFTYLYSLPDAKSAADDLYFRFKAYNSGSISRPAGILELTLKFKKYHNGVYEPGIDTGRYYWDDCEAEA